LPHVVERPDQALYVGAAEPFDLGCVGLSRGALGERGITLGVDLGNPGGDGGGVASGVGDGPVASDLGILYRAARIR
jgi:hypothetical protein